MSVRELFYPEGHDFTDAENRALSREELVYNVTEELLLALEDLNISKKELADRLGKSRPYVTQLLNGSRNMTLGSFSDICFVLGIKPTFSLGVRPGVVVDAEKSTKDGLSSIGSKKAGVHKVAANRY